MPKRCKVDNDSATYLWHCHLGHIDVKRLKKLHTDGLLQSLDYESFDTCEPCLTLQKKYTSMMIRVCHSRSRFLSCMYIHDDFMTESR